jgi:hypothetical protein
MDLDEFQINEAKAQLEHINESIKETRNKSHYIIGISFALFIYIFELQKKESGLSMDRCVLLFMIPGIIWILWNCWKLYMPLKLRFKGFSPENFNNIKEENEAFTLENILYSYQRSIDINGEHLKSLVTKYNNILRGLFYLMLVTSLFIFVWLFQRIMG